MSAASPFRPLDPGFGQEPGSRLIRASYLFGALLLLLWAAMAAWALHYFPRRTVGPAPSPTPLPEAAPVPAGGELRDCTSFIGIPGLRFSSYDAVRGDTFRSLSERHRVSEATLRSLNQANSRGVEVQPEDLVLIPSKDGIFHMVREGQGLSDIARAYNVPLREVLASNRKMNDLDLKAGEILYLPHGRFLWDTDPAWITLSALSRARGFMRPISARFTDAYGQRMHPVLQKEAFHGGLDLAAGMGTPVMASQDGRVVFEGPRGNFGNTIILDHGGGITSWYGHLSQTLVKQGQAVKRGDVIGKVGRSGRATGPHLHFEIRKNNVSQNPLLYLGRSTP